MRLVAVIFLTSLIMLAVLPQMSAAGNAMHDCAVCPETMMPAEQQAPTHHHSDAPCADMATCAPYALIDTAQPLRHNDLPRLSHLWPEPRDGTTVSLSLDLPPPRA